MQRVPSRFLSALFLLVVALPTLTLVGGLTAAYVLSFSLVGLLVLSIAARADDVGPAAVLLCLLYLGPLFLFPPFFWRVPAGGFLFPLLLTFLCLAPTPWFRASLTWVKRGQLDQITLGLVAITGFVSVVALGLWATWSDYLGVGSSMMKGMKETPAWLMLGVYIPVFALINAFAEEGVYRGFLQEALRKRFPGRTALVLGLQASAFAAAHYFGGFPNGKMGYVMTFVYALMLGYLRERSGGMLAPFVAHVVADLMIGVLLFLLTN